MSFRYDVYRRLEPIHPLEDLNQGFRAEVHDPAWFLAQQYLLGEHQGENASSPVAVRFRASHRPIDPFGGDTALDPRIVPPEAIVESEPGDWWTPGRRVAIGLAARAAYSAVLPLPATPATIGLLLKNLPPPYAALNATAYDGRILFEQRGALGLSAGLFSEVPTPPTDLWDPAEFSYSAQFTCAGQTLTLPRHDGGEVDWFSVDADAPMPTPSPLPDAVEVYPKRLQYPGAPAPRWWQIESAHVDIGAYPPDRSHFATMLLIDLIASHSDDWFTFPITTKLGHVVTLHEVTVRDSFDEEYTLSPPVGWSLFAVSGLGRDSLVLWPTVATPLSGPVLDEVVVGVDEDANLAWGVEQRVNGIEVPTPARPLESPPPGSPGVVDATARASYRYVPSTNVQPSWHPYVIRTTNGKRRFVQGRLADLAKNPPQLMPEPRSAFLVDPRAAATEPPHQIEPGALPAQGIRLQRNYVLGRRTDGKPILWMQRHRGPLRSPPISGLRFDVAESVPTVRT